MNDPLIRKALWTLAAAAFVSPLLAHDDDPKILHRQAPYAGPGWSRGAAPSQPGGGTMESGLYESSGVELLSWITLSALNGGSNGSDCWGYTSPSGREYAIFCSNNGTTFVEITNPSNPSIIGFIDGVNSLWRDAKVYQDHCYVVSEGGDGIQVITMANIDSGSVSHVGYVTTGGSTATHNVIIDTESGFLYRAGGSGHGLRIYDLSNPAVPAYMTTWDTRYVHDAQVVTYTSGPYAGRQIAFLCGGFNGGYDQTGLEILDVTNKSNIIELDRYVYPGGEYSHQGWLSEDRQFFYLGDELDEDGSLSTTTFIFDVSNINNIIPHGSFTNGNQSIGHNIYNKNGMIFEANYRSGLRVFDASDPLNPVEAGYFDTYPGSDSDNFNGLWSCYPYFDSGVVIGSDMERGLFIWWVGGSAGDIDFEVIGGVSDTIDPAGEALDLMITGNIQAGTERLNYDTGSGWQSVALTNNGAGSYSASLPAVACGTQVDWYLSATSTFTLVDWTFPDSAPDAPFSAVAGQGIITIEEHDMEAPSGWTSGAASDTATTGIWTRVDPIGTAAQPENDHTVVGTNAWITGQGSSGGSLGENDVDGGTTTLLTPIMDLSTSNDPRINYWRWYSNDEGSTADDSFVVDISFNSGSTWINVETLNPGNPEASGGWFSNALLVSDYGTPNAQVRMRFQASDTGSGSIVEAGIDDFTVFDVDCSGCYSSNYCVGATNSTGLGANIGATGSYSIADNNFTLYADSCPSGQNGIFYYGPGQTQVTFGNGFRCVTGPIHRLPVISTDIFGQAFHYVDFGSLPSGGQITAGSTWNFQFWYRDPAAGGAAFNLTNGLEVSFCP